jgi:hypothetical protein
MKKLTLALLAICLVFSVAVTSCGKNKTCEERGDCPKTLKEKLAGSTYGLGSVSKGGTSVTSDFTGFKMVFNSDASSVVITTGGTSSTNVTASLNVSDATVTITSTPPSGWASTLTNASSTGDVTPGPDFKFNVTINNPKTGQADHRFELVRQ